MQTFIAPKASTADQAGTLRWIDRWRLELDPPIPAGLSEGASE